MKILQIEPGRRPEVRKIDPSLKTMQSIVGGLIQALYPFDDPVALVCNDEGKLLGLPANRALRDEDGEVYDILCGTFFLCGAPADGDSFTSLTDKQMEKYQRRFQTPEMFVRVNGRLLILPCE